MKGAQVSVYFLLIPFFIYFFYKNIWLNFIITKHWLKKQTSEGEPKIKTLQLVSDIQK